MFFLRDKLHVLLFASQCCSESNACQSHISIAGAWRRGYTGKDVVVSVLDDGIEKEHPDLKPNYVSGLGQEAVLRKRTLIISNLAELLVEEQGAQTDIAGRSTWVKGLQRLVKSIGMDIKCLIHLTVQGLVNNALCELSDEMETDRCWHVLLLTIVLIQDPLASYDVNGQDHDPSPSYSDNVANL